MKRLELLDYLEEKCCVQSEYDENPNDDCGTLFYNTLNGKDCTIPNDDEISDLVVVFVLRSLNVDPPDYLDDFYNAVAPYIDQSMANGVI